jgi:hypothetical protein
MVPRSKFGRTLGARIVLALALFASPAGASGADPSVAVYGLSGLFWMSGAGLGVVTDAGIGYHLVWGGGRVPRSWAITGTVAWSVATVALAVVLVEPLLNPSPYGSTSTSTSDDATAGVAFASSIFGLTAGSLALSIYGLTRPPEPTLRGSAAAPPGVSLGLPMVAPTQSGARLVLGGTF